MFWLYLALIAYLINASVFIIDKHLLHSAIPKPYSYAFGVAVLSLGALFLLPFGVHWYGWQYLMIALLCGSSFFLSLFYLYKSIKMSDVAVASTQVGVIGIVFAEIFSLFILKERLSITNNIAVLFLVSGIILLGQVERRIIKFAIFSGILSALYFVLLKLSFSSSDLINGIFWTRLGFFGAAISTLIVPELRKEAHNSFKVTPVKSKTLFVFNKLLSGVGFLILYGAIKLGNVSLVNSLLGFQFLFTLILVLILKDRISGFEIKASGKDLFIKIVGTLAIFVGFIIIFNK